MDVNLSTFQAVTFIIVGWTGLLGGLAGLLYRWIALPMKRLERRMDSQDQEIAALRHEVVPNGDRDDDGRSLRAIVRGQTKDMADMKQQAAASNARLDRIEVRLDVKAQTPPSPPARGGTSG